MDSYLYLLRPTRPEMLSAGPTETEAAIVQRHFEYLQRLAAAGSVEIAGRTTEDNEDTLGIVILHAPSEAAAQAIVDADPAVEAGVMSARLAPFRVAVRSG